MNGQQTTGRRAIRLVAVMEGSTVTGPARNLIEFCQGARDVTRTLPGMPAVETSIVTFHRSAEQKAGDDSGAHNTAGASSPNLFVASARAAGMDVTVIPELYRFDTRVIQQLRRAIEQYSPDIIQTHGVKSHFLLRLSGLRRRYPWVIFHHGYTTTDLKVRLYNQLDYWSMPAADRVITVSQAFAHQLTRRGVPRTRIVVVHNSIQHDWSSGASEEERRAFKTRLGIADGERLILTVGRLSHEKGHAELVAAFAHLRGRYPGIKARLLIVGDGPERHKIEEIAAKFGVKDQIILPGHMNNVAGYYEAADLFVLSSHTEGSPNALLEAMASGLPIVATAVGGVPEIVTHNETALLVKPRDPQSMGEAMARMIGGGERGRQLAVNARTVVVNRFSCEARLRILVETYQRLWREKDGANSAGLQARWREPGCQ